MQQRKNSMIDTHLHILPGVDDGPETMEESLALALPIYLQPGFENRRRSR